MEPSTKRVHNEADAAPSSVSDVRMEGVTKTFGRTTAVAGVDLEVDRGEFFSLLGPSGSGKTTCLRMIAGFDEPTTGRILLGSKEVSGLPPYSRDVNTVFQDYALFPHMTVFENVEYGLKVKGVSRTKRTERVAEALRMVRLTGFDDRKPSELSGGQRQRVALARALINEPRVLLLDEPLGALDLKLRQEMQIELKAIQKRVGLTFIYVTHDQEEALTMSDRLAVMNEGRIEQVGTPAEVYERPATAFVAGFVGISNIISGDAARELVGDPEPFSIRPEKIRMLAEAPAGDGDTIVARGVVAEIFYLGSYTRFIVRLEAGSEVIVVQQNLSSTSADALHVQDNPVYLVWNKKHNRALETAGALATGDGAGREDV